MEHQRWYAERYLAGWQYAAERNDARLLHPSMRPWDDLPEKEKTKDRAQVGEYIKVLRELGYVVVRER